MKDYTGYEKVTKGLLDSLKLLDVPIVKFIVLGALILYNTLLIPQYNKEVTKWFSWVWFKIFFLLITIWVGCKDKTVALLMAIAYVVSVSNTHNINNKELTDLKMNIKSKNENINIEVEKVELFDEDLPNNKMKVTHPLDEDSVNNLDVNSAVLSKDTRDTPMGNSGIAGYEECYNNCNNNISNNSKNLSNICSSVQTWQNGMGAQGLNCKTPGWAGVQTGSNITEVIN